MRTTEALQALLQRVRQNRIAVPPINAAWFAEEYLASGTAVIPLIKESRSSAPVSFGETEAPSITYSSPPPYVSSHPAPAKPASLAPALPVRVETKPFVDNVGAVVTVQRESEPLRAATFGELLERSLALRPR